MNEWQMSNQAMESTRHQMEKRNMSCNDMQTVTNPDHINGVFKVASSGDVRGMNEPSVQARQLNVGVRGGVEFVDSRDFGVLDLPHHRCSRIQDPP